ncbi:GntR family transcriptional regulator [Ahrensia marina]|uniref:GntR family transcriptional regulator n=1 Tax=Ahrensia marina TaxID=1514904 RepID=UPI0006B68AA2|nr:GntR family transcriptional regulator [Ahrensia marina]
MNALLRHNEYPFLIKYAILFLIFFHIIHIFDQLYIFDQNDIVIFSLKVETCSRCCQTTEGVLDQSVTKLRYYETLERIRSDILSGQFSSGMRLKIADLAERYDTSHMPVREALRMLGGEGLVELEPNKGVRVRRFDRAFLENLFDIRVSVEQMQARRAAEQRTSQQLVAINAARLEFEAAAKNADVLELLTCNRKFHAAISVAAKNSEADEIELRHSRLLPMLWNNLGYPRERVSVVIDDHRHIEAAVSDRDANAAAILAAAHCLKAKQDMMVAWEHYEGKQNNR